MNGTRLLQRVSSWKSVRHLHRGGPNTLSALPQLKRLNKDDSENIAQKLRPLIGEQNVSLAEAVRSQHGQDEGPEKGDTPDVVVFAESTEHVSEVLNRDSLYVNELMKVVFLRRRFAKYAMKEISPSFLTARARVWKRAFQHFTEAFVLI